MKASLPRHHVRNKICANRPAYRDPRKDRAVKVYTINQESKYIIIQGVPKINVIDELVQLCALYGAVDQYDIINDLPDIEAFTEVVRVKYSTIQYARVGKRKLDDKSFFGSVLHVSYAPEYESVHETREKLSERRRNVARRTSQLARDRGKSTGLPTALDHHSKWTSIATGTPGHSGSVPMSSVSTVSGSCYETEPTPCSNNISCQIAESDDDTWTSTPVLVATIDLRADTTERCKRRGVSSSGRYESELVTAAGPYIYASQPAQSVDQKSTKSRDSINRLHGASARPPPTWVNLASYTPVHYSNEYVQASTSGLQAQPLSVACSLGQSRRSEACSSRHYDSNQFVPRQIAKRKLDEHDKEMRKKSLKGNKPQRPATDNRLRI